MVKKARDVQPELAPVTVRALMPLWAEWELVAPGTVYELPADAAEAMVALGMVELVQAGDGFDTAQTPTQPTEAMGFDTALTPSSDGFGTAPAGTPTQPTEEGG